MRLPPVGLPSDVVLDQVKAAGSGDLPWRDGKGWSLVYDSAGAHADVVAEAGALYAEANALSHSAFPSVAHFESEIVAMVASVVCPGTECFGVFTSGGTESILLALKAYRDSAASSRTEVIVPRTAHPAFGKAAQLLGLDVRQVPVGGSGRVDPEDVAKAIGPKTLVAAVSAPNFPFGVVDPVTAVAGIAAEHEVGVHVDAALGGLFLPFLAFYREPFGLSVPGVTSVSVDLHKYGYAPKGGSALLFGSRKLRHGSYYIDEGWNGGWFASASASGTRSGRAAAGAFASLLSLGESGLRDRVEGVMRTTQALIAGLGDLGLRPVGDPEMSVFAVTSDEVDVRSLARGLQQRGWWMDIQPDPVSLHFVVMPRHEQIAVRFLGDVEAVLGDPPTVAGGHDTGAYGVMVRDDSGAGDPLEVLRRYLDSRYDPQQ